MNLIRKTVYLFLGASIIFTTSCKEESLLSDKALAEFSESVNTEDIRHHIAVLADDSLKGRLPGTSEYKQAMAYVADRYKEFGITPIGDKERSTYYQTLELRNSVVKNEQSHMILNDKDTLQVGEDYFFTGNANEILTEFSADLVIAGFGVQAPEYGFNDFENLDVEGKIVAIFSGAPSSLPASERAYFSNTNTKIATLDNLGAQGILFVTAPGGRGNFKGSFDRMSQRGINSVLLPNGTALGRSNFGNMKFGGYFNWSSLSKLTGFTEEDWKNYSENGNALKQPLETIQLNGKVVTTLKQFESANVLGLLEGEELKDEYIVHTAHLDHVGIGRPIDGDSIYNGAHDNASGISAMIEIARLYSKLPTKPKRSVIFAAVTAEEMGLLGSKYLAVNPPVAQEKIIANVNTDMPTLIAPMLSIEPLGAEQSSIMNLVERSAKQLNLRIDPDHMPEQVRFVRSDNLNFVLEGIPALRMKYGLKTETSETGLDSIINDFTKNHYHKPSDELNDDMFNFDAAKTYVRLQFMNSYLINDTEEKPAWNEDSFFRKFKKEKK
ncbi:M28 family peptidase [Flavobacteriaceae bacterium S0825]|uniref:M28 family peptidase n=1 Tax=Gaetbulibacter sp. S0825 TaxID=2720084 RepID=UPI001431FC65|nr:M28 family peptidase [Gaetbulibacter sp. S0825]MCK0109762.1 M28 family peptidase [Flavobacteriaceae bacterium S0825]NIX65394.1 M28 family peptidase [Gaetbulibacter sp. S0825]